MTSEFKTLPANAGELCEPSKEELIAENFPELKNDMILRAARLEEVSHVPVWVMRQAGRYLPEYNRIGEGYEFFDKCRNTALASAITLQPLVRFPLDAAIIFSDILVILQALGMPCEMVKGKGPVFPNPIATEEDLEALNPNPDVNEELGYVFRAITVTRHRLKGHVPLIGFAGAPWTLFAYAIEGSGSKTFSAAKAWLYKYPEASHKLLAMITETTIRYLVGQVRAGAQLLQVFDSWAGSLSPRLFRVFAAPYLTKIASGVKAILGEDAVPMVCFAKGAHWAMHLLESSDYDVFSLDWTMDPEEACNTMKGRAAFQGNMDPCVMYADDATIREEVCRVMSEYGTVGHIANMGHGMSPDMEPRAVATFVDAVHKFSTSTPEYVIGTRGSVLALWQAHYVRDCLVKHDPTKRYRIKVLNTVGDTDTTTALDKFSSTGVFTDALERALINREIDCVVHSLKDVPSTINPSTALVAISERHDVRDCVVLNKRHSGKGIASLDDLPSTFVIGTSSARRRAFLQKRHPSLIFKDVRGNVKTRLRKLDDPENGYDALVLACAGLDRLNMSARISFRIATGDIPHAIGQAALGVQVRLEDRDGEFAYNLNSAIHNTTTGIVCSGERAFLRTLGGGCSLPIAITSSIDIETNSLTMTGYICSKDGSTCIAQSVEGKASSSEEALALGELLSSHLLENGGKEVLDQLKATK
eukprot:m.136259 g.136259  ORF g.136259 m.136259 type:complete len:702 (+) comp10557_c0_seq1:76-2181(+)